MSMAMMLAQQQGLSPAGWIVMITCISLVCGLLAFCYYRVLRNPRSSEHHEVPPDTDARDLNG